MRSTTSKTIADCVGGTLIGGASGKEIIHGKATVDSRTVESGDLFVAFTGERVDGHHYVAAAMQAGAALALVSHPNVDSPAILVDDPQVALEKLARHELDQARQAGDAPLVIALTGSSGKTSTKDLLAAILSPVGDTIAPVGSRNNELGLPLTVLEANEQTKYLVLEMGARGIGHIEYLTSIARPDISLVLNVGTAHVGEFGSVDNIARAKSEIVAALSSDSIAILNHDDVRVRAMSENAPCEVRYFGLSQGEQIHASATGVTLDDAARPHFVLHLAGEEFAIALQLTGEHHVSNALAAALAAQVAGLQPQQIAAGLNAAVTRSPGRMQVTEVRDNITVINDAYNANPDSMSVALKALAHLGRTRRTVAVLGEMLELGSDAATAHDRIGRLAVRLNISQLIVVGQGARAIHNGASLEGSFGEESLYVKSVDEAFTVLQTIIEPGDVILLKSSNGAGLAALGERLVSTWSKEGARE